MAFGGAGKLETLRRFAVSAEASQPEDGIFPFFPGRAVENWVLRNKEECGMKWMKGYISGLLTALLLCALVVTAGAKSGKVMQELTYRDIRVSLDGEVLDLRNAIGEKVEPFMFDGTNYLPVRALAEALGLNVAWNSAEVMVVLTTPEAKPAENPKVIPVTEDSAPTPAPIIEEPEATDANNFLTWDIPENQQTSAAYVLNTSSMKIHYPHCSEVVKIAPENYDTSNETLAQLEAKGYTTCGRCFR